jgi:AraC-like DNA-binding protein
MTMDRLSSKHGFSIAQPGPPFSPWLRLAHVWRVASQLANEAVDLRRLRDFEFFLQIEGHTWIALPDVDARLILPTGHLAFIPPGLIHAYGHRAGAHIAVHADLHAQTALGNAAMVERCPNAPVSKRDATGWTWRLQLGGEILVLPLIIPVDVVRWRRRFEPLIDMYSARTLATPTNRMRAAGILGECFSEILALAGGDPGDGLLSDLSQAAAGDPALASVPVLARKAGLGQTAYRAAVRRLTGHGPREHLERLRIDRAAYALRSGSTPIARIASEAGYDDPFHFSRVFRRVFGCSPRAFRDRHGGR